MPLVPFCVGMLVCLPVALRPPLEVRAQTASPPSQFGAVIRAIEYEADAPLERDHYDPVVGLKPGEVLTRSSVKEAIQRLHNTGRFDSILVDSRRLEDGVRVLFRLRFSRYFNTFSAVGDLDLGDRTLTELIELPVGDRYTPEKLEEARKSVGELLRQRGFYRAEVRATTSPDSARFQVNTVFDVAKGEQATLRSSVIRGVPAIEMQAIRHRLDLKEGHKYSRRDVEERLTDLRAYLLNRGYLGARPEISETYEAKDNSVALEISFQNFGRVRVMLEGYRIPKEQRSRLLPVLSGEGIDTDLLEEGRRNLKEHLEERGYSESEVTYSEEKLESGALILRYRVIPGKRVSVVYVRFRGNKAVSSKELSQAIQSGTQSFMRGPVYSIARLDSDVEALVSLYHSRGYMRAEVIPLVEPIANAEKLGITFEITEGKLASTRSVTVVGDRELVSGTLLQRMSLRPGSAYSPSLAEHDRQLLLGALNDAGYLHARVNQKSGEPDPEGAIPVEFEVNAGTRSIVDQVLVLGNDHTRDPVIRQRVSLNEGDPLSLGRMLQTQEALSDLGVFDNVTVGPQSQESEAPYQDLLVRVKESRRFTVRYGLGYETREKVRGIVELSDLNVLGRAKRADLRLRASAVEQAAILTFQQSQVQFLPVHSYFSISGSAEQEVSFDQTRFNTSYQYSKPVSRHSWALLRANYRNVRVYNLQVSEVLAREDTPRNLTTLSAIYVNDTRDSFVDAEKGFFTSTDFSVTTRWLGSNNYLSLYTQNSYFRRIPGRVIMAASLRLGLAKPYGRDNSIPISERFFSGGASSLRGFETDRAGPLDPSTKQPTGGNAIFVGNIEARIPLLRALRLAVFYDGGNVFARVGDMRFANFSHTAGAGLRVKTPLGPLRIDYGYNLNLPAELRGYGYKPGQFFITIGPPF